MKITKRQLRQIIREEKQKILLESKEPDWHTHARLNHALVDWLDAYTLAMGLNPGDPVDSKRIHAEVDRIVDTVLGI